MGLEQEANEQEMMAGIQDAAEDLSQNKGGRKPKAFVSCKHRETGADGIVCMLLCVCFQGDGVSVHRMMAEIRWCVSTRGVASPLHVSSMGTSSSRFRHRNPINSP